MSHPKYKNIGDPATRIVEECAELIKAVCKGVRFGWNSCHPDRPDINNKNKLDMEMLDILDSYRDLKKQIAAKSGD